MVADRIRLAGHLSYIYLGRGLTSETATKETVILYEPLSDHAGLGMNVLFGNGTVEWIDAQTAGRLLANIATGSRPVVFDVNTGALSASTSATAP